MVVVVPEVSRGCGGKDYKLEILGKWANYAVGVSGADQNSNATRNVTWKLAFLQPTNSRLYNPDSTFLFFDSLSNDQEI